jgi:hypothetical protein
MGLEEHASSSNDFVVHGFDSALLNSLEGVVCSLGNLEDRGTWFGHGHLPFPASPCGSDRVAKEAEFSLHAGVATEAQQRDKLERLCRYVTRPAVSEKRI